MKFVPGDLASQAGRIFALPPHLFKKGAEDFLHKYEASILKPAFRRTGQQVHAYEVLLMLYKRLAELGDHKEAIIWHEKSLTILNRSSEFRRRFAEIYLQLAHLWLQAGFAHRAIPFLSRYAHIRPGERQVCLEIEKSIHNNQKLYRETIESYRKQMEAKYKAKVMRNEQLLTISPNASMLHFNIACFYAVSLRTEEAIHHLEEALKKNYPYPGRILTEKKLEMLRKTREFELFRMKYLVKTERGKN